VRRKCTTCEQGRSAPGANDSNNVWMLEMSLWLLMTTWWWRIAGFAKLPAASTAQHCVFFFALRHFGDLSETA